MNGSAQSRKAMESNLTGPHEYAKFSMPYVRCHTYPGPFLEPATVARIVCPNSSRTFGVIPGLMSEIGRGAPVAS